jgi:ribosomal protein S18 acetylase RimI-like enzyme
MTISFGIEFEFDYVRSNNEVITTYHGRDPYYIAPSWDYQADPTAGSELRSPVFTSLEDYIRECNNQFGHMVLNNRGEIPYMANESDRSLGQHMHIGMPRRQLTNYQKVKIAKTILELYPFFASIQAQPIPSHRGLNTIYARSMQQYRNVISSDHYAEISASHIGTVELRIFDANIPQASLINAFFITQIAKKAIQPRRRNNNDNNNDSFDFNAYHEERQKALRYGLIGIDITSYLKKIRNIVGNISIPNINCIKEGLYLIARYRANFWVLWKYAQVPKFDYMKKTLENCSEYLNNIEQLVSTEKREKLRRWINEASEIENLDQIIGLSIATDRTLVDMITERAQNAQTTTTVTTITRRMGLTRSEVRELVENGYWSLRRLNEVPNYDSTSVAEYISNLLRNHGNQYVNQYSAQEIIESPSRYYVFLAIDQRRNINQICGSIAVHMRTGEISSLVVDRRFRRLGIARKMVQKILMILYGTEVRSAITFIRNGNEASKRLFESLGFKKVEQNDNVSKYEYIFRRD